MILKHLRYVDLIKYLDFYKIILLLTVTGLVLGGLTYLMLHYPVRCDLFSRCVEGSKQ